jgi:iron complex outermembrane receptor protein
VRGPASALYGNAAGGVLQLTSEPAPDAAIGQRVRVVGGSDGLTRVQSTTGGRTADGRGDCCSRPGGSPTAASATTATSAARACSRRTGWNGRRGALRARPSPGSTTTRRTGRARRHRAHARSVAGVRQQQAAAHGRGGRHGQLGLSWRAPRPGEVEAERVRARAPLDNPIPVRVVALDRRAGGARAAYTLGWVRAPTAPRRRLRPVRLSFGGEWQRQRDDRQNFANAQGVAGGALAGSAGARAQRGGFAQATAELGARATLLAGLRATTACASRPRTGW